MIFQLSSRIASAKDVIINSSVAGTKTIEVSLSDSDLLILDGSAGRTPLIKKIEAASALGKPQLNILTGMQAFENGSMKSYPHRVTLKSLDPDRRKKPIYIEAELDEKNIRIKVSFK